jgi:hypothetical protein
MARGWHFPWRLQRIRRGITHGPRSAQMPGDAARAASFRARRPRGPSRLRPAHRGYIALGDRRARRPRRARRARRRAVPYGRPLGKSRPPGFGVFDPPERHLEFSGPMAMAVRLRSLRACVCAHVLNFGSMPLCAQHAPEGQPQRLSCPRESPHRGIYRPFFQALPPLVVDSGGVCRLLLSHLPQLSSSAQASTDLTKERLQCRRMSHPSEGAVLSKNATP